MAKPKWCPCVGWWLGLACVAAAPIDARAQAPVLTGHVEGKTGEAAAGWQVIAVGRTAPQSIRLGEVLRHETRTGAGGSFFLKVVPGIG